MSLLANVNCNTYLHVFDFIVDFACFAALIRQRGSSHLGRQMLNGDSGGIVETRL